MRFSYIAALVFCGITAFSAFGRPAFDVMPAGVAVASCGAPEDPGDVPGDPWGNKCDLKVLCKSCHYSYGYCVSCDSTKKFLLCGTPANKNCADTNTASCGVIIEHQKTTPDDDCDLCHGDGKKTTDVCYRSACSNATVD